MSSVVVKTGQQTLTVAQDKSSTAFQSLTGIAISTDKIPYLVIPNSGNPIPGVTKTAQQLVGYCAALTSNSTGGTAYCVIGDINTTSGQWGTVSRRAITDLGLTVDNVISGNFTLTVYTDSKPVWSKSEDLNTQIQRNCSSFNDGVAGIATEMELVDPELIELQNLQRYIATLDRNSTLPDFKKLTNMGVAGVIIEAGYLFDVTGKKVSFRNPKIDQQVTAAYRAKMPHGLYFDGRARNTTDVDAELYEMYYLVNKYPPVLGVWMNLGLTGSVVSNDKLMSVYQSGLQKLGLKGRIGIRASVTQLKRITWDKFCEDWYLWLDKKVADVAELEVLLEPEFFIPEG